MKDLRGILAFAEGGASNTLVPRDPYEFLPFTVSSTASAVPPFSVTTFGQQALGLAAEDVSSPASNHFDGSFGYTQVMCTVVDQEPPTLVPPEPPTSEADAACQASLPELSSQAQAADNCTAQPALVISQSPSVGTLLSAGPHTITFQVTDQAGNTTTATTTHTVVDVTPPTISRATPSRRTLWPPNHKMVPVTVGVTLSDNCGNTSGTQCRVFQVTSNEPINGPGDGNTRWDWELLGPMTVNLRAERAGLLNSRIYTLWVECQDSAGQVATATTSVTVPHDQRGR